MSLPAGTRLVPYEIVAALGAGGMGEVYRARDTRLERTVAIKILPDSLAGDPEFTERFEREARAISSLDHPNICALYDVGTTPASGNTGDPAKTIPGVAYLVMQFVDGQTLAERLGRGPLPIAQALRRHVLPEWRATSAVSLAVAIHRLVLPHELRRHGRRQPVPDYDTRRECGDVVVDHRRAELGRRDSEEVSPASATPRFAVELDEVVEQAEGSSL